MKYVKNWVASMNNLRIDKLNPNLVLVLLVVAFIALLLAAENIVKLTLVSP